MHDVVVIPRRGEPVSAGHLAALERTVQTQLPEVAAVDVIEEWRAQARALESYLAGREMDGPMRGIQRRCEARIGQLLGEAKEGRPPKTSVTTDVSAVAKDDRQDFRTLAEGLDTLSDDEWHKSRRALVALIRNRTGTRPEPVPLPTGTYSLVVADPPWRLDTGPDTFNSSGQRGHDHLAYDQMSVEDIKGLPVAEHAAADAHLYLWTTNRYVEHAYDIARAWGFKPSVLLVWAKKPRGVGLGDAYKLTTEFVLYARRGSLREGGISETTWFNWPRGKHSTKPAAFYDLVERLSPAPDGARLEMFARQARPGWVAWGDEAPSA